MKLFLLLFGICFTTIVNSQSTIFSENVGTLSGTATLAANTFQNTNLSFSGTADTRTTTVSTGYTGASGNKNIFITNAVGTSFQISSISTLHFSSLKLSFGVYKSTTASNLSELVLEFSTNGTTYTALTIPSQPTGTGTATWRLISSIALPTSANNVSNLYLRWRNTSGTPQFRLDDIKLVGASSLPVELTQFIGYKTNEYNVLNWQTASEHNNSHFLLERSVNSEFSVIAKIEGANNSSFKLDYSFIDYSFPQTINYYRLIQVDFDGKYRTYDPISIDNRENKTIVKYLNILGQEVSSSTLGLIFEVYEDGSIKKIWR